MELVEEVSQRVHLDCWQDSAWCDLHHAGYSVGNCRGLDDTVKDMGGAVSSLEEDGDVSGDAGGDQCLKAGGDEEGGGDRLRLCDHSPDTPLLDSRQEGSEAVITDRSQTQPSLESLADEGERTEAGRTDLLSLQLAGLQLGGQFVTSCFSNSFSALRSSHSEDGWLLLWL